MGGRGRVAIGASARAPCGFDMMRRLAPPAPATVNDTSGRPADLATE